jgi:uncharacterized protein YndB with AHSA1/START domain
MPNREREVRIRRDLPTAPEGVWSFLVSPDGVATWLGRPDRSLDTLGPATITMATDTGDVNVPVVIEVVDAPHALSFLWRWPGEATSLVELLLQPSPDGCTLVLRHARLDATLHDDYRHGWGDHLDRLATALADHHTERGARS